MKYFAFLISVGIIFIPQLFFAQTHFEGYYLNNGISPDNSDPFWLPNAREVQGITNDGKNWYLTVTGHKDATGTIHKARLWKIPLSVHYQLQILLIVLNISTW